MIFVEREANIKRKLLKFSSFRVFLSKKRGKTGMKVQIIRLSLKQLTKQWQTKRVYIAN